MKLKKLLEIFSSILIDPILFPAARIIPTSFTKEDGKMPLRYLLTYLIFRQGKTLSEDICRFYPDLNCLHPPSKQAVLKRMSILNYAVWHTIQELFLERIYRPMKKKTHKGYLLIAVDGSFVTLPDHPVLGMIFGRRSGNINKRTGEISYGSPQAKISLAYDVLNKVILDFQVVHQHTSEIPLLFKHLEVLEDILKDYKVLILADRYYGSAELFKYCEMKGYKYIVRAKSNFFKKYRQAIPEHCMDCILNILIDKNWQRRIIRENIRRYISTYPVMDVRLVKGHFEYIEEYLKFNGSRVMTEHSCDAEYFTNLTEFSLEEVIHLYHVERWDIETGYGTLKNLLDLEQLNSANPVAVKNEIMAKLIFFNIENLVWNIAENETCEEEEHLVNNKHVIELCRSSWFIRSFFSGKMKQSELDGLIEECARVKVMIREGRHYRRWDKFRISLTQPRHRIDGRKNPPLNKTKAGFKTCNH